ncbi:uncharacterized protein BX664DRAFT_320167 [Halteromyces radiatus]|uniref:uncharacterized protein n=1 Tax=Halteromyces radiatus TaxID=101107 RepID=UPI00221F0841|nr:uncharacterized protein BX664DRAFT_320167 [Halteromyces radiatus]KAI8099009.1 hypothetical protein BX664DRAFT_320167 [Halteromyces radiatus]
MFAPEFLRIFRPEYRVRYLHSSSPVLRKCCGCIHLRAGAMISCLIWVGLSLYFAAVSFQHKSPFFSFMSDAAILVFGTANLFFACVAGFGIFTVFHNNWYYVSHMVMWISIGVFVILVDGIANVIIFIVIHDDYKSWCIGSASGALETGVETVLHNNATNINFSTDFYNCQRTWEDELKFSMLSIIMMIIFYSYWALCFYSYSIKKSHNAFQPATLRHAMQGGQMMDPMMNPMGTGGYYPNAMDPTQPNVIVLNNTKPSKSSTNQQSSSPPPYHPSNTNGNVVDLEKGRSSVLVLE